MPIISFQKNKPPLEVADGSNLMQSLLEAEHPVASSCDGEAVCGKCKIQILKGSEYLSKESEQELFLKKKNSIRSDCRISCQTQVHGDIEIDASYW